MQGLLLLRLVMILCLLAVWRLLAASMQGGILVQDEEYGRRVDIADSRETLHVRRYAGIEADVVGRLRTQEEVGNDNGRERVFGLDEADIFFEGLEGETLRDAFGDKLGPVLNAVLQSAAVRGARIHCERRRGPREAAEL